MRDAETRGGSRTSTAGFGALRLLSSAHSGVISVLCFSGALSSSRFLGFFQLPCLPQLRRCSIRSFTDIRLCFVCNFGDLTPTHGPVRPLHSGVNRKEVTGAPRRLLRHQLRCDRGGNSGEGSGINVGTQTHSSAHGQCSRLCASPRGGSASRLGFRCV